MIVHLFSHRRLLPQSTFWRQIRPKVTLATPAVAAVEVERPLLEAADRRVALRVEPEARLGAVDVVVAVDRLRALRAVADPETGRARRQRPRVGLEVDELRLALLLLLRCPAPGFGFASAPGSAVGGRVDRVRLAGRRGRRLPPTGPGPGSSSPASTQPAPNASAPSVAATAPINCHRLSRTPASWSSPREPRGARADATRPHETGLRSRFTLNT